MEETVKNLIKAFIGESQARNRYTMYAKQARKDGYYELEAVFLETAEQEREHAKQLSKMINQLQAKMGKTPEAVMVEAEGAAMFATTKENLKWAIEGEAYENTTMYPDFAKQAVKDGLPDVAKKLSAIGVAEKHHKERYEKLLKVIEDGTLLKKEKPVIWYCRKCGYVHIGTNPPEKCPSCDHEKEYFYMGNEEY
ncbi:MAG: rubrerythrin family protein [Candidatus Diapherotrites archaeon]|jgi:rubrerythrin|uniref:Rubrerythrin family protein n=1 Tax=Candidatus Iainarchaeum sp. TaxID=3101447 RepID=A0A7K4BYM2_9ARCH|nr:rubrerythrin family protein [Candidatus Diapherotrites archaeon]